MTWWQLRDKLVELGAEIDLSSYDDDICYIARNRDRCLVIGWDYYSRYNGLESDKLSISQCGIHIRYLFSEECNGHFYGPDERHGLEITLREKWNTETAIAPDNSELRGILHDVREGKIPESILADWISDNVVES